MKRYVLFAGVNGSGKSTLYQIQHNIADMPRINTDEILREFGDWKNPADLMKAGKIAVKKMNDYFIQGISFNQETTLCGKSIIRTIEKAKQLGYSIEMHYVGVDSVEIAKDRIAYRVENGGHGVPVEDVDRRYKDTFINLRYVIPNCNLVALYDNTENFRRFAIFKNGEIVRLSNNVPKWYHNFNS